MSLPLHRDAQSRAGEKACPGSANLGLWWERFFNCYTDEWEVPADDPEKQVRGKLAWVKSFATNFGLGVGDKELLGRHMIRREVLVRHLGGTSRVFRTEWRMVTGLGIGHPVENGFAWHPVLGVPYLGGAAVKGLLRGWCEAWAGDMDEATILRWFGPATDALQHGSADPQAGGLVFFDALPLSPVKLAADILTPHYGEWYAKGAERPGQRDTLPADWHDPVPSPFLAIEAGQDFVFSIAARPGAETGPEDVARALDALEEALRWIGAGAKTAAGYGRMNRNEQGETRLGEQCRQEEELHRKKMEELRKQAEAKENAAALGFTGLALEMVESANLEGWAQDKGKFVQAACSWLDRIESDAPEMLSDAARWLAERMEMHWAGIMANPDKTKGKKNKPVFKEAPRNLAHRLRKNMGHD